jgi:hypothetical protein
MPFEMNLKLEKALTSWFRSLDPDDYMRKESLTLHAVLAEQKKIRAQKRRLYKKVENV